jgi:hypothetical protein
VKPNFGVNDLDGEVVFDRFIGIDKDLNQLQTLFSAIAPKWSSKLRIWRGPKDQRAIDIARNGSLTAAVLQAATERGPLYRELVQQFGRQQFERAFGSVELRGADPGLIVVLSIDRTVVSPLGAKKDLGNHISFQVRRPLVEGRPANAWLREAFQTVCAEMSPAWGWAGHLDEYWAKAMTELPRVEVIGRDFGRFLPGLFWSNFFGRRYRDLVGASRLRTAPAERVIDLDDGVLIELSSDPLNWNTADYAIREQKVREHLGQELFFRRTAPDSATVVPDWES